MHYDYENDTFCKEKHMDVNPTCSFIHQSDRLCRSPVNIMQRTKQRKYITMCLCILNRQKEQEYRHNVIINNISVHNDTFSFTTIILIIIIT